MIFLVVNIIRDFDRDSLIFGKLHCGPETIEIYQDLESALDFVSTNIYLRKQVGQALIGCYHIYLDA